MWVFRFPLASSWAAGLELRRGLSDRDELGSPLASGIEFALAALGAVIDARSLVFLAAFYESLLGERIEVGLEPAMLLSLSYCELIKEIGAVLTKLQQRAGCRKMKLPTGIDIRHK